MKSYHRQSREALTCVRASHQERRGFGELAGPAVALGRGFVATPYPSRAFMGMNGILCARAGVCY